MWNNLVQTYSNLIRPVQQGLSQIGSNVSHAVQSEVQQAPRQISQGVDYVEHLAPQLPQIQIPRFQPLNIGNIAHSVGNYVTNQPVPSAGLVPLTAMPKIGSLIQNKFIQPSQIIANKNASLLNRGIAGLQLGSNAFPIPNLISGEATGILKTLRTGGNISQNVSQAIASPSEDIAGTGLGIKNPYLATGVDLLAGNPKMAINGIKGIAGAIKGYSPNAFNIHPEDQKVMSDFINAVQSGAAKADLGQLGKDAQVLAEHYIGKGARTASNQKLAQAFDALLSSAARARGEDALQTSFPKMGIVPKKGEAVNSESVLQKQLGQSQAISPSVLQKGEPNSQLIQNQEINLNKQPKVASIKKVAQLPGENQGGNQAILDQFKTGAFKTSSNNGGDLFQGIKGALDKAYTSTLDKFHPISVLGKQAGEDQAVRNAITGYYGTGSIGKYHTDFQLAPILKSVDPTDLRAYTVAQRDAELAGRGIQGANRGTSQQIIDALKTKYGGNLAPLEQAASKLYDYQKNLVKTNLVDTGIMSKEAFSSMTANNQKYIPFQRVMDKVDNYLGVPQKGIGSVGSQNVIKGIKGSQKEIKDPLQSIIENTYKLVGLGQRQKVAQTIVGLKDKLPPGMIEKASSDANANSTISVFENGKAVKYSVPPEVAQAAKGMTSDQMGTIIKILSAPTRVFRATATGANPEFALPNTARDLQSAFVNVGLNPLKFVSGLAHYMKKDAVYQDFLKSGGMTSRISLDQPFLNQSVKDLTGVKTKGIAMTRPSEIYKMLQEVGQASEQPTRIAAFQQGYNQALKAGKSVEEARAIGANAAQESSVNFARTGANTQSANAIFAFINARAQGTDRLIRAAKNDPVGVGFRAGLITAAPAVALYMHNRGFQSYNDPNVVSPTDKQNNFIYMLSDTPLNQFGGAQYIKIPKGDVGKLANPLESFMSYADGKGGDVQGSLLSALGAFSPINNVGDLIPTALRPGIENAANHSFFANLPIVPDSKKNYPAPFQTSKSTPAIYNQIGSLTNQSPNMIQNLARGYGTGYARLAEQATQPLANTSNYSGQDINNVPVARRFMGGAKKSPQEAQQNALYQQQAVQKQIQDIRTGVKYGNIPYQDGVNQINKLMQTQQGSGQTQPQNFFGPKPASAAGPQTAQNSLQQKMQLDQVKMQVQQSGQPAKLPNGDIIYMNEKGNVATLTLTPPSAGSGIDAFTNQDWKYTKAREVFKSPIPDSTKQQAYQQLGVDPTRVEYDYKAAHSDSIKTQYVAAKAPTESHSALIQDLVNGRVQSQSGKLFASNGVLDGLAQQGVISLDEAKALKAVEYTAQGQNIGTSSKLRGTRRGRTRVSAIPKIPSMRTPKAPKLTRIKSVSLPKVHLSSAKLASSATKVKPIRITRVSRSAKLT